MPQRQSDHKGVATSRRNVLAKGALGIGAIASLAGCVDSISGGNGTAGETWPPAHNRIDMANNTSPGSLSHTYMTAAARYMPDHIQNGDEIDFYTEAITGGAALSLANRCWNAPADGGFVAQVSMGAYLNEGLRSERAEYKPAEMRYPSEVRSYHRTILINHRTTEIEDHWQWSWQDFIEKAPELKFALLGVGHGSYVLASLIATLHPDLDFDEISENFIHYGGGGEARAAIQRGEADVYLGSFGGQYFRPDFYKTQFVITDPRFDQYNQAVMDITDGKAQTLADTDFSQEDMETIVDLTVDKAMWMLPPEVSDTVYDYWIEGFNALHEDQRYIDELATLTDNIDLFFTPKQEIDDAVQQAWQRRLDNRELLEDLLSPDS